VTRRDAKRRGRHLNLLYPRHRFLRDRIRKYQKGRDIGTRNSILLDVPFFCLLPLRLLIQYIVRLPRLFVFRGYIDIRHSPHKSTLFGRFIPRIKGRRRNLDFWDARA